MAPKMALFAADALSFGAPEHHGKHTVMLVVPGSLVVVPELASS